MNSTQRTTEVRTRPSERDASLAALSSLSPEFRPGRPQRRVASGFGPRSAGFRRGVRAAVLWLLGAGAGAAHAATAATAVFPGYDINKLMPDDTLIQYSVYGVDSVLLPQSTSGTATSGWFGSGRAMEIGNTATIRCPWVTVGANLYFGDQVKFDPTKGANKVNVGGNLVFRSSMNASDIFVDTVQVGGNLTAQGKVQFWSPTRNPKLLIQGTFTSTQSDVNFSYVRAGSVTQTGINSVWHDSVVVGTNAASFDVTPTLLRKNAGATPKPWSDPPAIAASRLPGYTIPWLPASGSENSPFIVSAKSAAVTLARAGSKSPDTTIPGILDCGKAFPSHPEFCSGDTLLPGDYGDFNLPGIHLLLGEGFYSFKSLNLSNGASLISTHPKGDMTVVNVRGAFSTAGSGLSHIGPVDAIGVSSYGTGARQFMGGSFLLIVDGSKAEFGASDTPIWATVSVPHGDAYFNSQIRLYGQVFANRVITANNIDFGKGEFVPIRPPRVITVNKGSPILIKERAPSQTALTTRDTTITVSIDYSSAFDISVDWVLRDGTAKIGTDVYGKSGNSGTITIPAGSLSATIGLVIQDDNVYEGDEPFWIELSNPKYAILPDSVLKDSVKATIQDDELPPRISFQATSPSGSESVTSPSVNVVLSAAATDTVKVSVVTKGGTATRGGAYSDYATTSPYTIVFKPGVVSVPFPFTVVDDHRDEPDETVALVLRVAYSLRV